MPMPRVSHAPALAGAFAVSLVAGLLAGCGDPPPGDSHYEREVEPVLIQNCARNTGGCHMTVENDPLNPFQFAAGNFDVTSFEKVQKRRDLLVRSGPYQVP